MTSKAEIHTDQYPSVEAALGAAVINAIYDGGGNLWLHKGNCEGEDSIDCPCSPTGISIRLLNLENVDDP